MTLNDRIGELLLAFYGRVSTEDQQDPQASYDWQITRARQLIQPAGGVIVAEYFDIGHTRALPWQRRPKASELLAVLRDPDRGFNAVVIGEPQRAFYGNQFSLTYPLFEHFGVQLWVPEVGGPIDPGSEAHDLAMTLFGSQSKGERMRIKTRVRAAMGAQTAIQGRYLGGRPPYGYRLADAGAHPNPAKARFGARLHVLEPDPVTAPVVQRIFAMFRNDYGYLAIAEQLNVDHIPSPAHMIPTATPTATASAGPSTPSARSSPTRATPATRCGTGSAATRSCWTSTTSPPATSPGCAGTPPTPGSGPNSQHMSR